MAATQYLYMQQGRPIAQRSSGSAKVYQYDGMGSVRQMVDKNGTVTDTFRFDMFGEVVSRTGTTKTPFSWNIGAGMQTGPDGLYVQQLGNGSSPFTMPPIWAPGGRGGRVWGGSTGLEFGPPFGRPTVEFRDGIIWIQYGDGSWTKIGPPHPIIGSIDRIIGVRIGPGQIVGPPAWQPPPTVLPPPGSGPPPAVVPPPGGGRTGPPIGGATADTPGACPGEKKCSDLKGAYGACVFMLCSTDRMADLIIRLGLLGKLLKYVNYGRNENIHEVIERITGGNVKGDPMKWGGSTLSADRCCELASASGKEGLDEVETLADLIHYICNETANFDWSPNLCAQARFDTYNDCEACCVMKFGNSGGEFSSCQRICDNSFTWREIK